MNERFLMNNFSGCFRGPIHIHNALTIMKL